jgi:hypothetical protein
MPEGSDINQPLEQTRELAEQLVPEKAELAASKVEKLLLGVLLPFIASNLALVSLLALDAVLPPPHFELFCTTIGLSFLLLVSAIVLPRSRLRAFQTCPKYGIF